MVTYYPAPLATHSTLVTTAQTILARDSGQVVIGNISNPRSNLLRIADGTQGGEKVLTSDASGNASWQPPTGFPHMQVYDVSGSWPPAGVTGISRVMVEMWGGGGGG
ncbi:MAG: hypothetical protein HY399_08345, partial [Elusimicrobia bacterium]|nr:hypothetical protein [Elusimicrobiota bacterium]